MSLPNDVLSTNLLELSNLYTLQNLLLQIQTNLILITQGQTGRSITVNGASLFQLAAEYYEDATLWTVIASANNLVDPYIPVGTPVSLIIPLTTIDNGGVLPS